MANPLIQNLGASLAALIASYGISKIADPKTSFVDTRKAMINITLQTTQALIAQELAKDSEPQQVPDTQGQTPQK